MAGFAARDAEGRVGALGRLDPCESIRPASSGELDEIAGLFAPSLAPYRGSVRDWILDAYLADLLRVSDRFEVAEIYVAVEQRRVLGSIAFYPDVALEGWSNMPTGWAGFRALAVHPGARGTGLGRRLVEHCIARTAEVGAPTLGIHTIELLADAVRLYERVGFVRCPEYDLRAADVFQSANGDDLNGQAFRYDL